ncbi:MAG: segregation/condensation protein A [Actinomycetota bacterium]|nr:segregation/condensation protein A [Actinomycetota bacterium]
MTESSGQYIIHYQDQSGPIKLLLELVQTKKADIYQISMNEIISGFVDFISQHREVAIDTLSGFIYTASVLLEIKSRSLLPSKNTENQKQQEISEEILKLRESEYRIFKKLSSYLEKSLETEELFFVREAPVEKEFLDIMPNFLEGINKNDLASIARNLFRGIRYSWGWILLTIIGT